MNKEELKKYLETTFPTARVEETFDFPLLFVDKSELIATAQKLKDSKETLFDFLFCETAVDRNPQFEVVYHLSSTTYHHDMVMKVVLDDRVNPEVESVYPLWAAAELYEDEIFDLFGIRFTNHPDLRRLFLSEEWGYPLRKDFKDDVNIITL